jgi:putative selenium metabolism protein SsnA
MLLTNGILLNLAPSRVDRADLRVQNGEIVASAKHLRPQKGEETIDLSGRYIMPGMVNAHTHLYSALARGMAGPKQMPRDFLEILRQIWWKLDEALDDEAIYYGALVGSIEALKYGTTTLVDHHGSPKHINGSLDIIKKGMAVAGLRGVLCYETTDRGGRKRRDAGLEENERFVTENTNNSHFRGSIGAHASFTLNDDTLQALGDLARMYDCGVHLHVAEDKADIEDAARKRRTDIVKRLQQFGILTHKSILSHGVHLTKSQLAAIDKSGAWVIHNPRSNMNNAVGYAPLDWFGERLALGTDGFPADMFEENKLGFFRNRESEHKVEISRFPGMLQAGQKLVSSFFGREFGTLKSGAPADLIVLDYNPPTPLTSGNLLGHFLFGMNSGMVVHTMVDGEWRMWNGELVGIDEEKIMSEATGVARKLWKRMDKARL